MSPEAMKRMRKLDAELSAAYTPVPDELLAAAERKLAGEDEAMVSLTSGGKLSRWAARIRAKAAARRAMEGK